MSSMLIREVRIGTQNYKLKWEKDNGFVVRENGYIVNRYGPNEKIARKKFSQKIYNIRHPKWKRDRIKNTKVINYSDYGYRELLEEARRYADVDDSWGESELIYVIKHRGL